MSDRHLFHHLEALLRRLLHLLARPVRSGSTSEEVAVQTYRGYGTPDEVFFMGRVFRQPTFGTDVPEGTLRRDLIDLLRRLLRWGLGDAVLEARFAGATQRVETDRDGYFRVHLRPSEPVPDDVLWHEVDLALVEPVEHAARAEGRLFIPPRTARCVVISDIDDTLVYTGVANKLKMLWRLFFQSARSRVAFPGAGALYRALHDGPSGADRNPMLYVSRGPWAIYDVLEAFFNLHDIPAGPILFLRDWGLTLQHPLPRRSPDHKYELIRDMLARYEDLPFVLIGDSGQRDPEIYTRVVREHPGRVSAVYIRNVSRDDERGQAIDRLAEEIAEAGSTLLLAADSFSMAEHAAEHGLLSPDALADVLRERARDEEEEPAVRPTRRVEQQTPSETREAVSRGAVDEALEEAPPGETPPNVVVEPEQERRVDG